MSTGKTIAFFDFDGTITTKDTMLVFFEFAKGTWAYRLYFLFLSPLLILYKLRLLPGQVAKETTLKVMFKGMDGAEFIRLGRAFCEQKIDPILRPKAMERLNWHRSQGHDVWIVSASAQEWLRPWAETNGINLICTFLQYDARNRLTGKIDGLNCNGHEKVRRIKEKIDLSAYETAYAYGDTRGDRAMLAMATYGEFKPFRK